MLTIEGFWKIDDKIKSLWGKKFYNHIDYCGLNPIRPMENGGYFCTPKNSLAFAQTGGNGVHFSIVNGINENGHPGPIVMTVPMAINTNLVIAEDFNEFFSIGYYVGWFGLEQLVYDLEKNINEFSQTDPKLSTEELKFINMIRNEFGIKYSPISQKRLFELEHKYFNYLEINDLE